MICDSCMEIAWDMGIKSRAAQIDAMLDYGTAYPIHDCDGSDADSVFFSGCDCIGEHY